MYDRLYHQHQYPRSRFVFSRSDGFGGFQAIADIGFVDADLAVFFEFVAPDAGVAVRLQFDAHGDLVGSGFVAAAHLCVRLAEGAEQVLYVVADFVRDDVGEGKFTAGAHFLHFAVEGGIDVEFLVGGAVEGAGGAAADA